MIGERIKEIREKRKMSQDELAEKSGVSRMTITFLETGTTKDVKLGTLKKLADGLGVSIKHLI